ncbi:MAG: hypothetical protein ACRDQA_26450 [Nocardioidaceae bacterium]
MVAALNDQLYRRLTDALSVPTLATDKRFATNSDRVRRREDLRARTESS